MCNVNIEVVNQCFDPKQAVKGNIAVSSNTILFRILKLRMYFTFQDKKYVKIAKKKIYLSTKEKSNVKQNNFFSFATKDLRHEPISTHCHLHTSTKSGVKIAQSSAQTLFICLLVNINMVFK